MVTVVTELNPNRLPLLAPPVPAKFWTDDPHGLGDPIDNPEKVGRWTMLMLDRDYQTLHDVSRLELVLVSLEEYGAWGEYGSQSLTNRRGVSVREILHTHFNQHSPITWT